MKTQRTILTIILTISSLVSFQLKPQGPGPIDMWDTLPPQEQLAPYIEATKFAKGVFVGMGEETNNILNEPGQAVAMGAIGLGTTAFLQIATPEVAATTTRVLCTLATAETIAQMHYAYQNAPENQKSESMGKAIGRMVTDAFFLRETARAASTTLTSFKPSQSLSYGVKIDDYAFIAKFNPDGNHLFSIGRNLGKGSFSFSVYGLDPIDGVRYYGAQSVKPINTQIPVELTQQTSEFIPFYSTIPAGANIQINPNNAFAADAEKFAQTAKQQQVERITSFINQLFFDSSKFTDYQDHNIVYEKISTKIDPAIYMPLENLLKTALENNIDALKESGSSIYNLLKYSGDPINTSNIKGANGEIYVGVLQQLMGRKLVDYNKEVKTANIIPGREAVTFDWAIKTSSDELILIEVKNQRFGGGDEYKFIKQIGDQLKTINAFDDLKNSKLEVWSEHPLTDVMKIFLNENGVKYFEGYSSLVKLYFPEMKQPIFFDNPTPTHIQQFSLLNSFLSQAPSFKFTPPTSWFTEHGFQPNEPPLRSFSSSFDSWDTGFAGMPFFNTARDWNGGVKWDSYFDSMKNGPSFSSQSSENNSKRSESTETNDDQFNFKQNGYYGPSFFRNNYDFGVFSEGQAGPSDGTTYSFSHQDGMNGISAKKDGNEAFLGFGGGAIGASTSYYVSSAVAVTLLEIAGVGIGLYAIYKLLEPTYDYRTSDFENLGAETPAQKRLDEAILYTPKFPWETFLLQDWKANELSLDKKPAKKQFSHTQLRERFKIPVPTAYKPDASLTDHERQTPQKTVKFYLDKVNQDNKEQFKKDHAQDELSDLYQLLWKTFQRAQHAIDQMMYTLARIDDDRKIIFDPHDYDEHMKNNLANSMKYRYQNLYVETAQGMLALQEYDTLSELILNKTIILKRNLDAEHEFLKQYTQKLDDLIKINHSTYLHDRKNALADSLAKPDEMTAVWRASQVATQRINRNQILPITSSITTFGLPIQHALDNELFIFKTRHMYLYYALGEITKTEELGPLCSGMLELFTNANCLNSRGNLQEAILQIDNLHYLFNTIVEPALAGINSPEDSKDKHTLCAVTFAFNLMQELSSIIDQPDTSFEVFKITLKSALEKRINETTEAALVHRHFCNGVIKLIDASTNNSGIRKLLETIQNALQMAKQAESLQGNGAGFYLLNMLIEKPEQFDDWVNKLKEASKDASKKKKKETPKEFATIKQLLDTKQCKECNLSSAQLNNQNLNDAIIDKTNFTEAELQGISTERMHAHDTNFKKAHLDRAYFKNADCSNASFEGTSLKNAYFKACILHKSQWHDAYLSGTIFQDTTSEEVDFSSAHFTKSFFGITPMILNSRFTSSKASNAEFSDIVIKGSSFSGLNAIHACFNKAVIVESDFNNADLTNTLFDHCTLKNVSFKGTKLAGTSWTDSKFENVDFTGADIHGVSFTAEQRQGAHGIAS